MATLDELHEVLSGMMAHIASGAENTGKSTLAQHLGEIDRMKAELDDQLPMLLHYLDKRSYAKALEFLEGRDETTEPGCSG